jgi:hypothetical protein
LSNVVMPASLFRERPGRTRIGSQLFSLHAASISMGQHAALEPRAALHSGTQSSRQPMTK